ncbi:MAG TPA: protease pro-enzyme activation domain-containing protein, partial [Candidatus Solibacter sp.]|nr:protease pro-enzyme activation domain-containing protein [Candidatus Solibacter sp.]
MTSRVDRSRIVPFEHSIHPATRIARDMGRAPAGLPMDRMVLTLQISPGRQAELEHLIAEQHDPVSPLYQKWLTPEEFGARFAPARQDIDALTQWLQSQGFRVDSLSRGRRFIEFSGTAQQVEDAFHTEMHQYELDGKTHVANQTGVSVPEALAQLIAGPPPLNNFQSKPANRRSPALAANAAAFSGYIDPKVFADLYNVTPLWNQGFDGRGQTIAVAARSNIRLSDVIAFRKKYGLDTSLVQVVLNGPDPGFEDSGNELEAVLDTEWAGAVAKGAMVKLVASKGTNALAGHDLSVKYIIDNNLAPVMNLSIENCEARLGSWGNSFYGTLWQQAAAQGISAFVASGDSGSAMCDYDTPGPASHGLAVNGFASSPYVSAVGGTMLGGGSSGTPSGNTSVPPSPSYIPESAWIGSGGGVSSIYPKPAWQTGLGVPAGDPGNPSQHHRYLPDVSLAAAGNAPYRMVFEGSTLGVYGTSVSSPAFAGLAAILAQYTGARNGNLNPRLYELAGQIPAVFHDVITGTNAVTCAPLSPGCDYAGDAFKATGTMLGYATGPGYDLATGLGSVDAYAMVFNWQGPPVPVLRSVFPADGDPGLTRPVVLSGSHFSALATVGVSTPGITVSNVRLVNVGFPSSDLISADFTIAPNTPPGIYKVSVRMPAGTSGAVDFTVNNPRPNLSSISPQMAIPGSQPTLTLTGIYFTSDATVQIDGSGVSLSGVRVINSATITATLSLSPDATPGTHNVRVTTRFGSCDFPFTVTPPPPTLSSISPARGPQGGTVKVTLSGTNLSALVNILITGGGIGAFDRTVLNPTTITATMSIAPNALPGAHAVSVETLGGTTGKVTFTVTPPPPVLTAILPAAGVQGSTQQVSFFGDNLAGATVNVSGSGITASGVTMLGPKSGVATFAIAANATLGARTVSLSNAGGTSAAFNFTVGLPVPTLTSISPASALQNSSVTVTLTGSYFAAPASVFVTAIGVGVSNVTVVNSATITTTLTIDPKATTGGHL